MVLALKIKCLSGAPERIRTSDPQIRSLVLYPAELRARMAVEDSASKAEKPAFKSRPAAPYRHGSPPGWQERGPASGRVILEWGRGGAARLYRPHVKTSISSNSFAPASSFASPFAGATICSPTGRLLARETRRAAIGAQAPVSVIA